MLFEDNAKRTAQKMSLYFFWTNDSSFANKATAYTIRPVEMPLFLAIFTDIKRGIYFWRNFFKKPYHSDSLHTYLYCTQRIWFILQREKRTNGLMAQGYVLCKYVLSTKECHIYCFNFLFFRIVKTTLNFLFCSSQYILRKYIVTPPSTHWRSMFDILHNKNSKLLTFGVSIGPHFVMSLYTNSVVYMECYAMCGRLNFLGDHVFLGLFQFNKAYCLR